MNSKLLKEEIRRENRCLGDYGIKNPVTGELVKMKAKVEKTITIEDGKHTGIIKGLEYKTEPYSYVDIVIKEDKSEVELKCGVPFKVTENTALGGILENFGAKLEVNKEIEIEDYLKENRKVEFITVTVKNDKGKFARIVSQSLKPTK